MVSTTPGGASQPRVCIVPRLSGGPSSDWYPWLKEQFHAAGIDDVTATNMPQAHDPTVELWVEYLLELLGDDATELARTVLIGHSLGCQAIVRTLARLDGGVSIAGALCVAAGLQLIDPGPP